MELEFGLDDEVQTEAGAGIEADAQTEAEAGVGAEVG